MTLNEIMNSCGSDKGNMIGAKHDYTPVYESWFEKRRHDEIKFMEVGIDYCQSLKAWQQYFTKGAIYMVDYANFSHLNNERLRCFQANQSDFSQLVNVANQVEDIDFFIDDGGHCMNHQQLTFGAMFPRMKSGGLFFIEDTHTSNWDPKFQPPNSPGYCYGQPLMINESRSSSTINVFKKFQRTGIFESEFLDEKMNQNLTEMIKEVIIYDDSNSVVPVDSDKEKEIKNDGIILIIKK